MFSIGTFLNQRRRLTKLRRCLYKLRRRLIKFRRWFKNMASKNMFLPMFFIVFMPFYNKFWAKIKESTELNPDQSGNQWRASQFWLYPHYPKLFFSQKPNNKAKYIHIIKNIRAKCIAICDFISIFAHEKILPNQTKQTTNNLKNMIKRITLFVLALAIQISH